MNNFVNIIGAGLTGPLLSTIFANKHEFNVSMYERSSDFRETNKFSGRSINLALSERGINALKHAGVYTKEFESQLIPMYGRTIHDVSGEVVFQPYSNNNNHYINSVSRLSINKMLIETAEKTNKVDINFNMTCSGIDLKENAMFFNEKVITTNNPIFGADGYKSKVAKEIAKCNHIDTEFIDIEHSYKELTILPQNNEFKLDPNSLHIWPRRDMMIIALPNTDKSFTCTLFMKSTGKESFEDINDNKSLISFFEKNFADLIPLIDNLELDFFNNPIGKLIGVKSPKWYFQNKALIVGDAAHATVPFYGQGMNAAFEDCFVLSNIIKNSSSWEDVFEQYVIKRKEDADTVLKLSMENYKVMRSDVLDRDFLRKQELSFLLNNKYPNQFIPLYTMVSFTTIPYSIALKRSGIQNMILDDLLNDKLLDLNEYNKEKSNQLINRHLPEINY